MRRSRGADHWKALLPFIQAFADGKEVEHRLVTYLDGRPDVWEACNEHTLFTDIAENYRIKPRPAAPPIDSCDAMAWAKSFVEHVGFLPGIA